MLDESGLAAPGWPLEHNWHLAVRRDREQTDLATDLLVEWLARDPILSDVDFASLLHRCVSLVCLVYVVYLIRCSHDKRNGGRRSSDLAGMTDCRLAGYWKRPPACLAHFGLFGLSGLFGCMRLTRWTRQAGLVPDVQATEVLL